MKVIKNINNNVSLCLDSNQNEVIAFGKGIGFTKPPYKIGLNKIERVYYDVEPTYVQMINDIPEQIIDISTKVIVLTSYLHWRIIFNLQYVDIKRIWT